MRSRNGLIKKQNWVARWVVAGLLVGLGCDSNGLFAEEITQPGWRQGVSRWTGSGYTLPADAVTAPVTRPSTSALSEAPYTIPVDPTALPSATGLTISGPATQTNPYLPLPPSDEATSMELVSPSDVQRSDASSEFILPPEPIEPPLGDNVPLAKPEPIERIGVDDQRLPAPAAIAPPVNAPANAAKSKAAPNEAPVTSENVTRDSELPDSESIADQIDNEVVVEPAPLEAEVIRWYQYPQRWMRGWDSHAEFGLDGSSGNARTLAIQTGLETKRQTDVYTLAMDVDYRQASNRGTTTEDNGRFNLDYDRLVLDTPWAGFGKYGMEWDKFKAFDLRLWGNAGIAYHWVRTDDASLVTRFGAGASKEIGAPDDSWIPEAVFAGEASRQLTSRQKVKGKVEYFPAWEDFGNYRIVSDLAWEILLDGSENLSLRLAATDRYDSTPQGAKKNDLYYSLLLLYKF